MVNSCVAFGCTNRSGSGVGFHKIPCDKEREKLWLNALKPAKPPNLKHARVCSDHFLEEDYDMNYKLESELLGKLVNQRRFLSKDAVPSVFSFNPKEARKIKARSERQKKRKDRKVIALFVSIYFASHTYLNKRTCAWQVRGKC